MGWIIPSKWYIKPIPGETGWKSGFVCVQFLDSTWGLAFSIMERMALQINFLLRWFTVRQKLKGGWGWCRGLDQGKACLGLYCKKIVSSEAYALLLWMQENLWMHIESEHVHHYSGNQAALKVLLSCRFKSELVLGLLESTYYQLAENIEVHLYWVPDHHGHSGNEKEDASTWKDTESPIYY